MKLLLLAGSAFVALISPCHAESSPPKPFGFVEGNILIFEAYPVNEYARCIGFHSMREGMLGEMHRDPTRATVESLQLHALSKAKAEEYTKRLSEFLKAISSSRQDQLGIMSTIKQSAEYGRFMLVANFQAKGPAGVKWRQQFELYCEALPRLTDFQPPK